jgi:hypothetical protein
MHDQILFVRIGWGDRYYGEILIGNFREPNTTGSWWERFNFTLGPGDQCYGYVPPLGAFTSPPNAKHKDGWLVVFCAKSPVDGRLLPVGWYEKASFEVGYKKRPASQTLQGASKRLWNTIGYCVSTSAHTAYLIPARNRRLFPDIPTVHFPRSYTYARLLDADGTAKDRYSDLANLAERIAASKGLATAVGLAYKDGFPENAQLDEAAENADQQGAFDPVNTHDAKERIVASIVLRRGQPEFRQKLLAAYNGRCAISDCDCVEALEAAHIQAYLSEKSHHVQNGLLLRSDIHSLFDLGKISVDTKTWTVIVSADLKNTVYSKLQGIKLHLPVDAALRPSVEALNEHRKKACL